MIKRMLFGLWIVLASAVPSNAFAQEPKFCEGIAVPINELTQITDKASLLIAARSEESYLAILYVEVVNPSSEEAVTIPAHIRTIGSGTNLWWQDLAVSVFPCADEFRYKILKAGTITPSTCQGQLISLEDIVFLGFEGHKLPLWLTIGKAGDEYYTYLIGYLEQEDGTLAKIQPAGSVLYPEKATTVAWRGLGATVLQCDNDWWYSVFHENE